MADLLNVRNAGNVDVKVPRVWTFPGSRMKRAIRTLVATETHGDVDTKTEYRIEGKEVYRSDETKPTARYSRRWHQYYPRVVFNQHDEDLWQAVAPYAVIIGE